MSTFHKIKIIIVFMLVSGLAMFYQNCSSGTIDESYFSSQMPQDVPPTNDDPEVPAEAPKFMHSDTDGGEALDSYNDTHTIYLTILSAGANGQICVIDEDSVAGFCDSQANYVDLTDGWEYSGGEDGIWTTNITVADDEDLRLGGQYGGVIYNPDTGLKSAQTMVTISTSYLDIYRHFRVADGDSWYQPTTTPPNGYINRGLTLNTYKYEGEGMHKLYSCYVVSTTNHFIAPVSNCGSNPSTGENYINQGLDLGYVYINATGNATKFVGRCYSSNPQDHILVIDSTCPAGYQRDGVNATIMGYIE